MLFYEMSGKWNMYIVMHDVTHLHDLTFGSTMTRLLLKKNFREPFGLPKIKVGSPSHNFRSPELISD